MSNHLIGIDIGTTGAKTLLITPDGSIVAKASHEYPMDTPRPTWTEQNPDDWWQATVTTIRSVIERSGIHPKDVASIGLTGQMHGLVLLDRSGRVLRPCILWNDQRTVAECDEIREMVGKSNLIRLTGNDVLPGFTAPKLLWVKKNEPVIYEKIGKLLLPKDFIRYCLSGSYASEVSDASGTSLFDVQHRRWSADLLAALEVPGVWLPTVTESIECSAVVSREAARATGLLEGTPIVGGGGDQAAQAFGVGIVEEGLISATLGTSGVIFAASNTYRVEPEALLHSFCHAIPGMWHLMGVTLSAGGSLRWYRDTFAEVERLRAEELGLDPYEILSEEAKDIPPGSEGLLFLPYLSGERTPINDPYARGVFFGISLRHTKHHFVRSILEGVAYSLRDSLALVNQIGVHPKEIIVSGGGARSDLWRQIMADVLGLPLLTTNSEEGAAFGAALLAGVGAQVYPSPTDAIRSAVKKKTKIRPSQNGKIYQDYYQQYHALYQALKGNFVSLENVVNTNF